MSKLALFTLSLAWSASRRVPDAGRDALDANPTAAQVLLSRRFLMLSGAAVAVPFVPYVASGSIFAQGGAGGPKLNLVLRHDLQGQGEKVQETIVNVLEMPAGASSTWALHPGAQELLFVLEGSLMLEVEGLAMKVMQAGTAALIPADIPHLAHNDGTNMAKALVTHSRADKEKPLTVVAKR